jgi:hypothetical protein
MGLASEFNLEVELKNIILVAFRFFEFLHSQGQKRKWPPLDPHVRSTLKSRHRPANPAGPFRATCGLSRLRPRLLDVRPVDRSIKPTTSENPA